MNDLLPRVIAILSTTPPRWVQMASRFPTDMLSQKPAPGEWSAVECLQHIIDTEYSYQFRVKCFMEGKDFPGFDPDKEGTKPGKRTAAELAAELYRLRAESLKLIATLGEADLDKRVRHQKLGPVTLGEMLNAWAAHDLNHTVQAERALMQPYIHGCGPWVVYFQDHLVKEG